MIQRPTPALRPVLDQERRENAQSASLINPRSTAALLKEQR